jgi:hypothetical protein
VTIALERTTKILIGALLLIGIVTAITRTSLHAKRPQQQAAPTPTQGRHENPKEPIERVPGIPLSAQWAMSPLGGDWVDWKVETERGVNRCVIYDYQTGSVTGQGDYVASDAGRQADVDELTLSGFDDTHIYLADGHVLEPLEDPLRAEKDQGIRCERR